MKCPLCAGSASVLATELRRGTGIVYYCPSCDLGFLDSEQPYSVDHYRWEYRRHASQRAMPSGTTPEEIFNTYVLYQETRLGHIRPYLPKIKRLLEVGASAGQFLYHIKECDRFAVELDQGACNFMGRLGIDADCNTLKDSPRYLDRFDAVCAFQVMEHTNDPVMFLEEILHVMEPCGMAFIEVPNLYDPLRSVWNIEAYERFYFHGDHRFYFSEKSLRLIAEKAGAPHVQIIHTQDYNLLNHMHWMLTGKPQADCHAGLSPIRLPGVGLISKWLSKGLAALNVVYQAKLMAEGKTSNLMMVITKEE